MSRARSRSPELSRRSFLQGSAAAAAAGVSAGAALDSGGRDAAVAEGESKTYDKGLHEIELRINGAPRKVTVETRTTLLDALRERADMTGTKKVCDRGSCGGCTVLADGRAVNACMMLAIDAIGLEVTTIEGLASDGRLHPLQQQFVECDALQCGFCTPGMVMAGLACLGKHDAPTREQIRDEMAGNICRCGTYGRVFQAIERAASRPGARRGSGR